MRILITILLSGVMLYKADAQFIAAPSTLTAISTKTNFVKIPGGYLGAKNTLLSDRGIYRWSRLRYSISIVRYDDKMNFVAESKLADGAYIYSPFPPRLILGDKLWVVYGEPGTKYNMGNIQATEIDITTLKLLGTKMIASEEEIGIKNTNPGYDDFDIRFRNSPDNKYRCLFISNSWDDDFFLACLDGELKLLWKSGQRIPKSSAQEIGNVVIKNDGEVLITSVHKGVATLSRFAQNGAAENQTLDFGDSKPQYVDILESQAGQLYVGGTLQRGSKFVNTVFLAKS